VPGSLAAARPVYTGAPALRGCERVAAGDGKEEREAGRGEHIIEDVVHELDRPRRQQIKEGLSVGGRAGLGPHVSHTFNVPLKG
jgi:hypothetical protein